MNDLDARHAQADLLKPGGQAGAAGAGLCHQRGALRPHHQLDPVAITDSGAQPNLYAHAAARVQVHHPGRCAALDHPPAGVDPSSSNQFSPGLWRVRHPSLSSIDRALRGPAGAGGLERRIHPESRPGTDRPTGSTRRGHSVPPPGSGGLRVAHGTPGRTQRQSLEHQRLRSGRGSPVCLGRLPSGGR